MDEVNEKRLNRLLARDWLDNSTIELLKDFKSYAKDNGKLTEKQEQTLKRIYGRYFINPDESKKENKSLEDF